MDKVTAHPQSPSQESPNLPYSRLQQWKRGEKGGEKGTCVPLLKQKDLERLADPADKWQLYPYDDGRLWYLVKSSTLTLGEVAHASQIGDAVKWKWWVSNGDIVIYKSIRDVPGSLFLVIYFENAYFLKLYES